MSSTIKQHVGRAGRRQGTALFAPLLDPVAAEDPPRREQDQPQQDGNAPHQPAPRAGRMPFQHRGNAERNPQRDQKPRFHVDPPDGHRQPRQEGEGDDQPRTPPPRPSRPASRRQGQQHPKPEEHHQVDQRDQPDEVPGHHGEPVRRAEGSIREPGGDLELARGEPAPCRKDQHVDRAKSTHGFGRSRPALRAEDGHRVSVWGKSTRNSPSPGVLMASALPLSAVSKLL